MIANYLYRNPRILFLLIVVIVVAGLSSFFVMPRLEDPVLGRRVAVVSTAFPGASAERVEALVTIPIESALAGVAEIKQVRSNSQTGISNVVVELSDDTYDVDPVWSTVRNQLASIAKDLPESSLDSTMEVVPLKAFAAIIAVRTSDGDSVETIRRTADRLQQRLLAMSGTEEVRVFGDPGEEVLVEVSPLKLAETGLSVASIASQVSETLSQRPAGRIETDDGHLLLDVSESESPVEQVRQSVISFGAGNRRPLSDFALTNRKQISPPATETIIDGKKAIVLGVMVDDTIRVDQWADQLQTLLTDFEAAANLEFRAETDSDDSLPPDVDGTADADQADTDTADTKQKSAVSIDVLFSQRQHIDQRMETLLKNLAFGTLAVMVVVLVLMGWRSMIVVGAALPLSAFLVLWAMKMMSIPVHQMSVTGLIVALGLLIDNAIVIVDDVRCRIDAGKSRSASIVAGIKHLAVPLLGSTLTTAMAFLPIATLPGPPGEFVGTIAISVILAISASFLLAMTVIPAFVGLLNGGKLKSRSAAGSDLADSDTEDSDTEDSGAVTNDTQKHQEIRRSTFSGLLSHGLSNQTVLRIYEWSLNFVLKRPILGVLLGCLLPFTGFVIANRLPEQFFPPSDRNQIQIEVELPSRSGIASVQQTVERLNKVVGDFSEVQHQYWFTGGSAATFYYNVVPRRRGTEFYAQAFVDLEPGTETESLIRQLQSVVDLSFPEARILVRQLEQGPPFDAPIELRIVGEDSHTLKTVGAKVRSLLAETSDVIHTRSDFEETIPDLRVTVDEEKATEVGLSRAEVIGLMYTTLEGASAGNVLIDGQDIPVRVKAKFDGSYKLDRLAALPLPHQPEKSAPINTPSPAVANERPDAIAPVSVPPAGLSSLTLGSLISWQMDSDAGAIVRIDGRRTNEIKAYIQAGVLPSEVIKDFKQRLAESKFEMPSGYFLEWGGEAEQRSHAVQQLIANGVILFALMLFTLVASFQSFRCAFVIASVGALSAGLGPVALFVFKYPLGFMAIVGTMGLVGIAINDSIVVLAAIRSNQQARQGERFAVVQEILQSTRHIIATTVTTIVGFWPLIAGGGGFWPPMAITIAGGVAGATLLALYFTPALYLLMCRNKSVATAEGSQAIN